MLRLPPTVRVFVATRPVSASAGADVLAQRVRSDIGNEPSSADIYCFFNRRRTRVKLLVWDRNGYWVLSKRLERGRFEQVDSRAPHLELSRSELVNLLSGIDTKTSRFRAHFAREVRIHSRAASECPRAAE
jgi:transposase